MHLFGSKQEIEKHIDNDHGDLLKCQECGIVFKDDIKLCEHKESQMIPEAFPCEFCSLVFAKFPL